MIKQVTTLCNICVPLFLFLAGYGYELNKNRKINYTIKKIYKQFWFVLFTFIPILIVLGKLKNITLLELIMNATGFHSTICSEWWFLGLYVEMTLWIFIINRIFRDCTNCGYLIIISFVLMVLGYSLKFLSPNLVADYNFFNPYIYTFLIKQPIYISGVICCKKNIINKIAEKLGAKGVILFLFWGFTFSKIPESLYLPFIVPVIITAFITIPLPKIFHSIFYKLGIQSTFMWFTHSLLIYKVCQKTIYFFHISVINFMIAVILDYILAYTLSMGYRRINPQN